ncbi:MAG TPA: filamentous hemagglutinin N-terminal domain-containing protein, partial [Allocoleopsis sp.]
MKINKNYQLAIVNLCTTTIFTWLNIVPEIQAQIVPDPTLGTNINLNNGIFNITGGTQSGQNLFHSFDKFNLLPNNTAYFNNSPNMINIINRVTGGTVSNIDGIIKANGSTNIFLINPNGIIFGLNAKLNIGGSFVATTANGLGFGNLGNFTLNTSQNQTALLTINPSAFLYNQIPNSITHRGILEVQNGKNIIFTGGDININGGTLIAPNGNIQMGGLTESGVITLDNFNLIFPEKIIQSNVSLSNNAN